MSLLPMIEFFKGFFFKTVGLLKVETVSHENFGGKQERNGCDLIMDSCVKMTGIQWSSLLQLDISYNYL